MVKAIWNGTVIAESDKTVLVEGNHYFPLEAVNQTYLRSNDHHTTCFWKGVIRFLEEFGLTFMLAVDESDRINDMYSIVSQPSTLILDKEGVIIYRSFGITLATQIEGVIQEALNMSYDAD